MSLTVNEKFKKSDESSEKSNNYVICEFVKVFFLYRRGKLLIIV